MKREKILEKIWLWAGFVFAVSWICYSRLPRAYFEQDEWHSFGHYIYLSSLSGGEFWGTALRSGLLTHFTPLSLFSKMVMFKLFGLEASYYFLVSIFLHGLVGIAVFYLINLLVKNKFAALAGGLFFVVNASHHQGVTWLGTFEGTECAVLWGVLSLVLYLLFREIGNKKYFIISLLMILVASLYKETAITFLVLLAALIIFEKEKLGHRVGRLVGLGAVLVIYGLLRFSYLVFGVGSLPSVVGSDDGGFGWGVYVYNLLTLPVKILSQVIIPQELYILVSKMITIELRTVLWGAVIPWRDSNLFVYDILTVFSSLIILGGIGLVIKRGKQRRPMLVGVSLVFLTALPLLVLKKHLVILDSRFFYPASVGAAILLAGFLDAAWYWNGKVLRVVLVTVTVLIFGSHLVFLQAQVGSLVKQGRQRREILTEVKKYYPRLAEKAIIFTESDKAYYGLAQRTFPFQSGLGQVLMVLYQQDQSFPAEMFTGEFLWDVLDQGYKEVGERGFGYFRDFDKLTETISESNLGGENVVALGYSSADENLVDITAQVRGRLEGYNAQKKLVSSNNIKTVASVNDEEIGRAFDGNRLTFWDSGVQYMFSQRIEVELDKSRVIAQIKVDSYNNKDQDGVGYRVLVSDDGEGWQEVFYSKRYPPSEDGIVDLFFKPTKMRRIKLEQIGYHQYATWVIHEISIYEAIDK